MLKVFCVKTSELEGNDLSWLCPYRKAKADSCLQKKDRLLSLSASLALEKGLNSLSLTQKEAAFGLSKKGKPYLIDHPEIHFSLSHAGEASIAVFASEEIGCDLERKRPCSMEVVERCFASEERDYLESSLDKEEAFTRVWVYKESFLKAIGEGIAYPLSSFSTVDGQGNILLRQSGDERDWLIEEIRIEGYIAAICHQR